MNSSLCFIGDTLLHVCRFHRIQELLSISVAGLAGMISFFLTLIVLHFSGFRVVLEMSAILKNR